MVQYPPEFSDSSAQSQAGYKGAQLQARHKSAETTMRYDQAPLEMRREALERTFG